MPSMPSSTMPVAPPRSKVEDISFLSRLCDRVKHLERDALIIRGNSDVSKSKAEKAVEREKYLLGEVVQINKQL